MKKIIFFTFIFLNFFVNLAQAQEAKNYFRMDYGLGHFKSNQMEALNVRPTGNTVGLAFGSKFQYVELGGFYRKNSFEADFTHDSLNNKILHQGSNYGLEMNIFLNQRLSLKLGYTISSFTEKLSTAVSAQTMTAIRSTYGLEESHTSSKVFYGASFDFFGNQNFDLYASVIHFPASGNKSTTTAQVGFRIYMKSIVETFFSHRD